MQEAGSSRPHSMPSVSVIMAACATEQSYYEESVGSVLTQTFTDFEFIIVDDGLSIENRKYLASVHDNRLLILTNERNLGQSRSVNRAMSVACGEYIVRMDADDIMEPERIAIEVEYMRAHSDTVIAGALARRSDNGRVIPRVLQDSDELMVGLCFANPLIHPTLIIRADAIRDRGLRYDEDVRYAQDYMLYVDACQLGEVSLIPSIVLRYRVHAGQITNKKGEEQSRCASLARAKHLARMGLPLNEEDAELLRIFIDSPALYQTGRYTRLVKSLLESGRQSLKPHQYRIFERELYTYVLKAAAKRAASGHPVSAFFSPLVLSAVARVQYWRHYLK